MDEAIAKIDRLFNISPGEDNLSEHDIEQQLLKILSNCDQELHNDLIKYIHDRLNNICSFSNFNVNQFVKNLNEKLSFHLQSSQSSQSIHYRRHHHRHNLKTINYNENTTNPEILNSTTPTSTITSLSAERPTWSIQVYILHIPHTYILILILINIFLF